MRSTRATLQVSTRRSRWLIAVTPVSFPWRCRKHAGQLRAETDSSENASRASNLGAFSFRPRSSPHRVFHQANREHGQLRPADTCGARLFQAAPKARSTTGTDLCGAIARSRMTGEVSTAGRSAIIRAERARRTSQISSLTELCASGPAFHIGIVACVGPHLTRP